MITCKVTTLDRARLLRLYVVEWSAIQGQIHIHRLGGAFESNLQSLRHSRTPVDFLPLGIFDTHEHAIAFANEIAPMLEKLRRGKHREHVRANGRGADDENRYPPFPWSDQ